MWIEKRPIEEISEEEEDEDNINEQEQEEQQASTTTSTNDNKKKKNENMYPPQLKRLNQFCIGWSQMMKKKLKERENENFRGREERKRGMKRKCIFLRDF